MRTFALITAAMLLATASAQAGPSRSLTLASVDQPAISQTASASKSVETGKTDAAKTAETTTPATTDAPQFVERPAAVTATAPKTNTETTNTEMKADNGKPARSAKAERSRHKKAWTEARIINELHRHGIYW